MKFRKTALVLGFFAVLALAGCGAKDKEKTTEASTEDSSSQADAENEESEGADDTQEESAEDEEAALMALPLLEGEDWELDDCMILGEYKGLELECIYDAATDDDVTDYIDSEAAPVEVTDEDATVEDGDTVNLAYEGKKDGVAFDGGTSDSYDLVIGSDTFIDGFEDGMIGMKVGETKDLNLTFPEDYNSEELAGQDVVFTVTVHSISRAPEIDDAWVEEYTDGEYTTLEAYKMAIKDELTAQNKETAMSDVKSEAWSQVIANATIIQLPQVLVEKAQEDFEDEMTYYAEAYEMTMEEYIETYYGYDEETYAEKIAIYARSVAQNKLVLQAVTKAEGFTTDSDEYQEGLNELAEEYGLTTDELIENYGEETVNEYIFSNLVMDKILSYATINETMNG